MAMKRTDPELARQLDAAHGTKESVAAVLGIRRTKGKRPVPAEIEKAAKTAVARAADACGVEPDDVHVMPSMAVAYVSGTEEFIRELMNQPEFVSAVANQRNAT